MGVNRFEIGDKVRIDIPDETDPDFEEFHGQRGEVIRILHDDAGVETSDERDNLIYRVRFADGERMDFRRRDLRPPLTD